MACDSKDREMACESRDRLVRVEIERWLVLEIYNNINTYEYITTSTFEHYTMTTLNSKAPWPLSFALTLYKDKTPKTREDSKDNVITRLQRHITRLQWPLSFALHPWPLSFALHPWTLSFDLDSKDPWTCKNKMKRRSNTLKHETIKHIEIWNHQTH